MKTRTRFRAGALSALAPGLRALGLALYCGCAAQSAVPAGDAVLLPGQPTWQSAFTFTITGWGAGDSVQAPGGSTVDFGQVVTSPTPFAVVANTLVLAPGDTNASRLARAIRLTANTVGIACGEKHTLLLKRDGTVDAIGSEQSGQAVVPPGISNIIAIAAGTDHNLVLNAEGRVLAWGWDDGRQICVPSNLEKVTAIAAGKDYSLALLADGTVRAWGGRSQADSAAPDDAGDFEPPSLIRHAGRIPVVAIAGGPRHALALRADGSVVGWGRGSDKAAMTPLPSAGPLTAISAGSGFSVGLRRDGTLAAWGDNRYHQLEVPRGLKQVVALASGSYHTLALRSDGTVVAWGNNGAGQTAVPPVASNVVAIAAGGYHSEVLQATGPVLTAPRIQGGLFGCELNLPAGRRYRLQASRDLIHWVTIKVDTAFPTRMRWGGPLLPVRSVFYRAEPVWPADAEYLMGYRDSSSGGPFQGDSAESKPE